MILPNVRGDDPRQVERALRLLDEKISELYGIHGEFRSRNVIQGKSAASTDEVPILSQITGSFVSSSRVVSAGAGLTGGGTLSADITLSVDLSYGFVWTGTHTFNTTVTLKADTVVTDGVKIGSATAGVDKIYIRDGAGGGTARATFPGIHLLGYAGGDVFFGGDNSSPGFYAQRVTIQNSAVTDYSEDITNLFQGNSTYQGIEINYTCGDGTTGASGQPYADLREAYTGVGAYNNGAALGGGGLAIFGRANNGMHTYLYYDEANKRFKIEGYDGIMTVGDTLSIGVGGTVVVDFVPLQNNQLSLGTATLQWKDARITGNARAGQLVADADTGGTASTLTIPYLTAAVSGATPATLGNTGGGPTGAAQSTWIKVYDGTTAKYIPAWT